jgi:hypothetical protein
MNAIKTAYKSDSQKIINFVLIIRSLNLVKYQYVTSNRNSTLCLGKSAAVLFGLSKEPCGAAVYVSRSLALRRVILTTKNAGVAVLTISTLEDQQLIGHLILKIVPLLLFTIVHLYILAISPRVNKITCHGVFREVYCGSITNGKRPVDTRSSDRVPDTRILV